jgi:indole-3-glycerol phosphate synthase
MMKRGDGPKEKTHSLRLAHAPLMAAKPPGFRLTLRVSVVILRLHRGRDWAGWPTSSRMNKLDEIIAHKRIELQKLLPRADKLRMAAATRNDFRSLTASLTSDEDKLGLIAEVKKASPSVGVIQQDFDYLTMARAYEKGGASAISVLTDEKYFQGRLEYMTTIRAEVGVPVLRKDFIIHEAQIFEAAVAGADAILLIVAVLDQPTLEHLLEVAHVFQLEVLMEVHDLPELERALRTDVRILGVNNRNLKTFQVDLGTTELLAEEVPDDIILVTESGIKTVEDARRMSTAGANALLVGETLMRSANPIQMTRELMAAK